MPEMHPHNAPNAITQCPECTRIMPKMLSHNAKYAAFGALQLVYHRKLS